LLRDEDRTGKVGLPCGPDTPSNIGAQRNAAGTLEHPTRPLWRNAAALGSRAVFIHNSGRRHGTGFAAPTGSHKPTLSRPRPAAEAAPPHLTRENARFKLPAYHLWKA